MKKIILTTIAISLSLFSAMTFASSDSRPQRPPIGNNPALEAAMKECSAKVSKEDRTAFDSCMTSKGFKKPEGSPPPRQGQSQGSTAQSSSATENFR